MNFHFLCVWMFLRDEKLQSNFTLPWEMYTLSRYKILNVSKSGYKEILESSRSQPSHGGINDKYKLSKLYVNKLGVTSLPPPYRSTYANNLTY